MQHASKPEQSLVDITDQQKNWILAETQGMADVLMGINKIISEGGLLKGVPSNTLQLLVKNRLDNLELVIITYKKQIKDGTENLEGYLEQAQIKKKMLQDLWTKIV